MTTIRDLLADLIEEIETLAETDSLDDDAKDELLDTYTGVIKERIVG